MHKTIEDIISAKMKLRAADGLGQGDAELLDDLLGVDESMSSRFVKRKPVVQKSGRGVPSGGNRTDFCTTGNVPPPHTNRGVTKYQSGGQDVVSSEGAENIKLQRGGYDGGVEIGFEGTWDTERFTCLKEQLQKSKEEAADLGQPAMLAVGERVVLVDPSGASAGLHYRYKMTISGVVIFIHHQCPKGRQAVRVRYGAASLIGRSLFDVHAAVLCFLSEMGFSVTKETISRIDMQVLVDVDPEEFVWLCFDDERVVRRSQDDVLYRKRKAPRTFLLGHRGRLELCIYDKSAELVKMSASNPVKFQLMVDHCLGDDYTFDQSLTRVEFRLWRDILRLLDINTVSDLRRMETSLANWLTSTWFRILAEPKVRGHENTAAVHSLWKKVQEAFLRWFPGEGVEVTALKLNRDKAVKCEPLSLQKQALGCLKTAFALSAGLQDSAVSAFSLLNTWIESVKYEFLEGLNERALRLQVRTGASARDCCDIGLSTSCWRDRLAALGGGRSYG